MVAKVNEKKRDRDKERDRKDNRRERKSLILAEVLCVAIFVPTALLPYRTGCHKPPWAAVGLLSWTLETTAANWGPVSNNLVTFHWALLFLTTTTLAFSQTHGVFSFRCFAWVYSADVVIVVVCQLYSDQFSSNEGGFNINIPYLYFFSPLQSGSLGSKLLWAKLIVESIGATGSTI